MAAVAIDPTRCCQLGLEGAFLARSASPTNRPRAAAG